MNSVAVGLSRDLAPKRVMRAVAYGHDLAVWRDGENGLHAWDNRCPHRGMRLSHGFVRGDRLACLYHGWQYRKDGGCAYIPAHPGLEPPETIRAQTYSVIEKSGVIWVSTGNDAQGVDTGPVSEPLRSLTFFCAEAIARAAFEDTPFAGNLPQVESTGRLVAGGHPVAVLANPVTESETLIHVLTSAGVGIAAKKALSRWCEAARSVAERQAA
ncbi:Rieske (2Fe-2S) protein [uncultured Roseobacter sp.]|uniref:Rieske (2Fe-2S) protein n=1 Tax=uncultured Roseobacter sp. TaxID=114847 RepID=UPI002624234A|nr:Rieske (2Fe-2S) protein [uncultured Roseobacter sp.]